ncbi:MAG: hypothetical protein A3G49_00685 [Candidatus Sungbacteria bacterium RIFCSPLOWO2_12_FULL_41_11]|uniref:Polymerase nucleotidyl transferase domain-containing protein n=1 Tax=Candidatus Sungbacteria bacterium RIFCSPLOWO2_12_FULL_41_11 TaxID=1802286 RepID=A0A1G2LR16_9BACT|nr:MAG: hypothetical protein UV01_C0014G0007 [Parcubacteria group bacterium GW2011_GWA2_42_14]OHA13312.1 MAG: hypothetical protein A3G49_00685 [Candidatus Sungbacteria bacterium RIFCSPLOWO2_12_FULL_41_11]
MDNMEEKIPGITIDSKIRLAPDMVITPPPVESLLAQGIESSYWPRKVRENRELDKQVRLRRNLSLKLDALFHRLPRPTADVTLAVDSMEVNGNALTVLYESLAEFFESDKRNARLVLYLPFELLPALTWRPQLPGLAASIERFINAYMRCWKELLGETDVRANFADGNILEPELSPNGQKMVRKAAHLIPILLEKRYISMADVMALVKNSSEEILKNSIADTLPAIAKLGLITDEERGQLPDWAVTDKSANQKNTFANSEEKGRTWFFNLHEEAEFELKKMDMRLARDLERGYPKARALWERIDREEKLISEYANNISKMLAVNSLTAEDAMRYLSPAREMVLRLAAIRGIGKAIELIAENDFKKAALNIGAYENTVRNLCLPNSLEDKEEITSMLSRLFQLGLIDEAYINSFGLVLPKLNASFSDDQERIKAEIREFAPAILLLATDPVAHEFLHPFAIFYGSFLKGYARNNADLDVAVFVKPGIPVIKRKNIQDRLRKIFSHERIKGKIVEYWLEKKNGMLEVRDFTKPDVYLADRTWIHLLFAGIWMGKDNAIKDVYEKLLPGFLYSGGKILEGRDARMLWLGEMEREVLQYRLMHKGYFRLNPREGGIDSDGTDGLDPQSAFWDSGYRRLATILFIKRVFLPQLEENFR